MPTKVETWAEEKLNWDEIPTEAPPPPDAGLYELVIDKATPGAAKQEQKDGTRKAVIAFEFSIDRAHGQPEGSFDGKKNSKRVFATCGFNFMLKQLINAAGVQGPSSTNPEVLQEFCAECLGKKVWAMLTLRSYEKDGKMRTATNVDSYHTEAAIAEALAAGKVPGASGPAEEAPTATPNARRAGRNRTAA